MVDTSEVKELNVTQPTAEEHNETEPVERISVQHAAEEHTWTESVEIAGGQLVDRVKALIAEGNVRRLIIRTSHDKVLLEIPLTAGVAVGGVMTMFTPVLVALGAMAALVELVKVEIIRVKDTVVEDDS